MLLTFLLSRTTLSIKHRDVVSNNKYWIIVALIITNVLFVGIDLLLIQEKVAYEGYEFANLLVKISFIYLVLSSIFRVFMSSKETMSYHTAPLNAREKQLAKSIVKQFEVERLYRSLDFNRLQLADSIGVSEHHLSRIVNQFFGKSFSELTNEYRINDAIKRLENSKDPITVIAFDTGFNSITSFNRVFKLRMGISPSEYRNTRGKDG
jgi:AraC-like DNA-binding protein